MSFVLVVYDKMTETDTPNTRSIVRNSNTAAATANNGIFEVAFVGGQRYEGRMWVSLNRAFCHWRTQCGKRSLYWGSASVVHITNERSYCDNGIRVYTASLNEPSLHEPAIVERVGYWMTASMQCHPCGSEWPCQREREREPSRMWISIPRRIVSCCVLTMGGSPTVTFKSHTHTHSHLHESTDRYYSFLLFIFAYTSNDYVDNVDVQK